MENTTSNDSPRAPAFTLEIEDGLLWLYTMDQAGQPLALALGDPDEAFQIMADKLAEQDFGK